MTCIKMGSDDSHFNVSLTYLHTPPPPKQKQNTFSPSLISLMVSVDVKHHVYLLTKAEREKAQWTLRGTLEHRFPPRKDVVNQGLGVCPDPCCACVLSTLARPSQLTDLTMCPFRCCCVTLAPSDLLGPFLTSAWRPGFRASCLTASLCGVTSVLFDLGFE